ncbi:MAG: DUF4386 family protein [Gemmatimonadota bacterium]
MGNIRRTSRIIGILILALMTGSGVVNFVLGPLFAEANFPIDASAQFAQIGGSVLLGLATGATLLAITITAFPILRPLSLRMALWLVALAVVTLAITAVEQMGTMSMVSLSQAYTSAGLAEREQLQAIRGVVSSAGDWSHYLGKLGDGSVLLVLYAAMYRFSLVPRALAAAGLICVLLQLSSIAMPFFGHGVIFLMLAPLGLCQLFLALWLIIRGFRIPAEHADA